MKTTTILLLILLTFSSCSKDDSNDLPDCPCEDVYMEHADWTVSLKICDKSEEWLKALNDNANIKQLNTISKRHGCR